MANFSGRSLALALACFAGTGVAQTIQVDAAADRKPIDPRVYGLAYADTAALNDLNVQLNRRGGNNTSRYNWQENADNRGFDWYFQSVPLGPGTPAADSDAFVTSTRAAGGEPMLTVPMIGWLGKLGPNRSKLASFSQALYGAQADCDWTWYPDACNGLRPDWTTPVTGNNPNDASVLKDAAYQRGYVQHDVAAFGPSVRGGVRYYVLDNETAIWFSTHRDVHPVGPNMEEIRDRMKDYAARIREGDGTAVIVGPEEWGWTNYLYSGYDSQWASIHGWGQPLPDRTAHGNMDYMPWLLQQLRQHDLATGARTLDVFTLHYYPQGGEFSNDTGTSMQQRRNRSTRSLWDPNYTDETWIADKVKLIPRMKQWVSTYYPGLQTGVTEYNWGAESHINGATTQADVLGIFGREGLDLAARWTTPAASTPTYKAMKLFRNYDGARSSFGEVSVRATVPDPDTLSAFASVRQSDGALTVMVISKALSGTANVIVNLANFAPAGSVDRWQLTSANAITHLSALSVTGGTFSTSVPSPSVTLYVLPAAGPSRPRGDWNGDAKSDLLWRNPTTGQVRISYMDGSRQSSSVLATQTEPDSAWEIVGTHDFSGDSRSDILWRNASTGALRIWAMNGPTWLATTPLSPGSMPDLSWRVTGTGDLNSDGKPDILWRQAGTGKIAVWMMNGVTQSGSSPTAPDQVVDENWIIAGTGDFNADGKNDLIWRQNVSGNIVIWLMNGTTRITGLFATPASLGDVNWRMAAVGDFTRDGQPDVLWRHRVSFRTVLWEMDGLVRSYGLYTTPDIVQDGSWLLVGPK